jgi:uncharacterized protein (UPF0548 family)
MRVRGRGAGELTAAHRQAGEERFAVELAPDGAVYYDIYAKSKPGTLLAVLAYPVARLQQAAFAWQSLAAVQRHVSGQEKRS